MYYSAQILADYRKYVRHYGATVDLHAFVHIFWHRLTDASIKIPKAMEDAFADPQNDDEALIKSHIDAFHRQESMRVEQELFKQRKRLADSERTLQTKVTKAATESKRIATSKVEWALGKLGDLRRTEPVDLDSRIFPAHYAPVMVWENGRRVVKPMRYQCRLPGKPAFHDAKFPGTYNARRDNLEGYWRELFGHSHAVVVIDAFFENVSRHSMEGRALADGEAAENVVLEFRARPAREMAVACLWSRWSARGHPDLLSFAAITDEPPAEVAAAGHGCIIPIQLENVDAWLQASGSDLKRQYSILDAREQPYYQHRLAA